MTTIYYWVLATALFYVLSGVITYGLAKGWARRKYLTTDLRHTEGGEVMCLILGTVGPFGLALILPICLSDSALDLCFRMPKELCEPRQRPS